MLRIGDFFYKNETLREELVNDEADQVPITCSTLGPLRKMHMATWYASLSCKLEHSHLDRWTRKG